MMLTTEAVEAFSDDEDLTAWLEPKIDEGRKIHPHKGVGWIVEQEKTVAYVDVSKIGQSEKHAGTPWLIFGIAALLAIAIVYERK